MSDHDSAPGQDSFLDIVANLVGILIILVVIVGAQAATVWKGGSDSDDRSAELNQIEKETELREQEARSVQLENVELNEKIEYQQRINENLSRNRHMLLVQVESKKKLLEHKKLELGNEKSLVLELESKIESTKQKIEQVKYEFNATDNLSGPVVKTIEHYPTPIAKTVFADEIHFQLKDNRIAYVPMDELIGAMKAEWKLKAAKLSKTTATAEAVGPIESFRLKYFLRIKSTDSRAPSQYGIEFEGFVMQPTRVNLGETVDEALIDSSRFHQRIKKMRPEKTTVSFWVYPNSYKGLLKLRTRLREMGFQTASWPLEHDQFISGGPNGMRTSTN